MSIKKALEQKVGTTIRFKAVISDLKIQKDKNGNDYLALALTDRTGSTSVNIFQDFAKLQELATGTPILVTSTIKEWNSTKLLNNPSFKVLEDGEYSTDEFIDCYPKSEKLEGFLLSTINDLAEPWKTLVVKALDLDSDRATWERFLIAPSAIKHHGNKLRGLFYHTLGVLTNLADMISVYSENKIGVYGNLTNSTNGAVNKSRLFAKAILHDLGKIDEYLYDTYIGYNENSVGHILDTVCLVDSIVKKYNLMTGDELKDFKRSILTHHGEYEKYGRMKDETLEDILLHLADMIDSRCVGELEKIKRDN